MTFRLRPKAEADITNIALYIAKDNRAAAGRWIDEMYLRFRQLGETPGIGVARPEIREGLRVLPAGRYLILYRETGEGAEIVRVVHGARQWQELL